MNVKSVVNVSGHWEPRWEPQGPTGMQVNTLGRATEALVPAFCWCDLGLVCVGPWEGGHKAGRERVPSVL